jgi:hypothetical protein
MKPSKERKLLELMIRHYSPLPVEGWVSMELILQETAMSSFNQRFQEWRKSGITIENRMMDRRQKSEYKLFTHPQNVDVENIRYQAVQMEMAI